MNRVPVEGHGRVRHLFGVLRHGAENPVRDQILPNPSAVSFILQQL